MANTALNQHEEILEVLIAISQDISDLQDDSKAQVKLEEQTQKTLEAMSNQINKQQVVIDSFSDFQNEISKFHDSNFY
jgi:hypothetical protein